jgi:hypothetical protein
VRKESSHTPHNRQHPGLLPLRGRLPVRMVASHTAHYRQHPGLHLAASWPPYDNLPASLRDSLSVRGHLSERNEYLFPRQRIFTNIFEYSNICYALPPLSREFRPLRFLSASEPGSPARTVYDTLVCSVQCAVQRSPAWWSRVCHKWAIQIFLCTYDF